MKRLFKKFLLLYSILLITASLTVCFAQSPPPPPPPNGGSNTGHDLGGNQGAGPLSSPINGGLEILLLMAIGYAGFNGLKLKKRESALREGMN